MDLRPAAGPAAGAPPEPVTAAQTVTIEPATAADLDTLVRLEAVAFRTDRLSRRAFRYLMSKANAVTLTARAHAGGLCGYAIVLFHRGMPLARLYSIAVAPDAQGSGIGRALLQAAERAARDRGAAYLRLEVRADAERTRAFYKAHGFRRFGLQRHYYADGGDAIQMQKSLAVPLSPPQREVPYIPQTLDFTCGPAALLMAMRALDPSVAVDQTAELRLWRESTTIFMTSGHGGCSPEGLALAGHRRGFAVDLYLSDHGVMFLDSVRSQRKRDVIRLVQEDFRRQLRDTPIPIHIGPLTIDVLLDGLASGGIPLVLVSSYRFDASKSPHWVVVTGFDDRYVYLHDPNVDADADKSPTDCMQIPILRSEVMKMARYGRSHQQAALIVRRAGS